MTKNLFSSSVKFAAGCSMLAISASVGAQNADNEFALEEIIVTAQRREQSLRDVPISVSSLQGDQINDFATGGSDIRLLSARIPGLNAESSNGRVAPRFYLRGLGNTDFDLIASQPVSVVMDDVVMENVVHKSFPLFDLERVEVIRGPQGTLFGRNTPAGIIKFDSRKPTEEANGYLTASYGSLGQKNVEAAFGQGVSDTVSFRLSALFQDRNDYIDNAFLGTEDALGGYTEKAARAQMLYKTDNFDALAMFQYRDNTGTSALFRANVLTPGSNELNNNFDPNGSESSVTDPNGEVPPGVPSGGITGRICAPNTFTWVAGAMVSVEHEYGAYGRERERRCGQVLLSPRPGSRFVICSVQTTRLDEFG